MSATDPAEELQALPYLLRGLSDQEAAARIFAALQNLDESGSERRELRASGVAEHTVQRLYPRTFSTLVEVMTHYLRANPFQASYSPSHSRWLEGKQADLRMLGGDIKSALRQQMLQDAGLIVQSADYVAFKEFLLTLQPDVETGLRTRMVQNYVSVLWELCWYMEHLDLLADAQRKQVCSLLITACWGMFPYLREA